VKKAVSSAHLPARPRKDWFARKTVVHKQGSDRRDIHPFGEGPISIDGYKDTLTSENPETLIKTGEGGGLFP